ncbi:hypothetical protein [Natronolimnohabitans innermongolicus]|uniref:Uncharacterized protein n=1 Tax=Natronolimnohabitans innermongolicus JCM 12255 TaxID=1227499 RepID=L9WH83_9EURY|nr:hypothetical protein [Natronolimnohabitans innermongolicus]ELY48870.1 hypothetical protein C493_21321 [Natronolimnohabitans innermongolicus JCM 12255]
MSIRSVLDPRSESAVDDSEHGSGRNGSDAPSDASIVGALLLVALGTAAVAHLVTKYLESTDADDPLETARTRTAAAVPEPIRERAAGAVPTEARRIPIGEPDSPDAASESSSDVDADSSDVSDADADDPIDDAEANADLADDPGETRVVSGSSEEIQDRPAEPGEMAVDEDVEEAVGEDDLETTAADADETDTEAGEADAAGDEADAEDADADETADDEPGKPDDEPGDDEP